MCRIEISRFLSTSEAVGRFLLYLPNFEATCSARKKGLLPARVLKQRLVRIPSIRCFLTGAVCRVVLYSSVRLVFSQLRPHSHSDDINSLPSIHLTHETASCGRLGRKKRDVYVCFDFRRICRPAS